MVKALDAYTAIYRKGCTPPDAVDWAGIDNNKAFLAQRVVMTSNTSLSIPNALKRVPAGRLLSECRDDRVAERRRLRPAARHRRRRRSCGGVRGRAERRGGQGLRPLPRRGWLACPLARFSLGTVPAADAKSWSSSRSGSTRAIRTACVAAIQTLTRLPSATNSTYATTNWRLAPDRWPGERLGKGHPPRRRRGHQPRAGGRRGDRPDQADPERVAGQAMRPQVASPRVLCYKAGQRSERRRRGTR